jgi:hypothetical protein
VIRSSSPKAEMISFLGVATTTIARWQPHPSRRQDVVQDRLAAHLVHGLGDWTSSGWTSRRRE